MLFVSLALPAFVQALCKQTATRPHLLHDSGDILKDRTSVFTHLNSTVVA